MEHSGRTSFLLSHLALWYRAFYCEEIKPESIAQRGAQLSDLMMKYSQTQESFNCAKALSVSVFMPVFHPKSRIYGMTLDHRHTGKN